MTTEEQKREIAKAITTPTNYTYLIISLLLPGVIIITTSFYLTGILRIFIILFCISIIALIIAFLYFQKNREKAMKEVISHALNTNSKIITSTLSESFLKIESSDHKYEAKILRSKLEKLKTIENIGLIFSEMRNA